MESCSLKKCAFVRLEFIKKQLSFFGRIEKVCQPEVQAIRGLDEILPILPQYFIRDNLVWSGCDITYFASVFCT